MKSNILPKTDDCPMCGTESIRVAFYSRLGRHGGFIEFRCPHCQITYNYRLDSLSGEAREVSRERTRQWHSQMQQLTRTESQI